MGARGFIGFDTLYRQNNRPIFIETNYRATGSTNPLFAGMRASNLILRPDQIGFIGINDVNFSKFGDKIGGLAQALQEYGMLYDSSSSLDNAMAIMNYGNQPIPQCDLYLVWEQGKMSDESQFARANEILEFIGDEKRVSMPTLK